MILFELKLLSRRLFSMAITLVVTILIFVGIFPFMDESGLLVLLSEKLDLVPNFLIRMLGLAEFPDFTRFPHYFNLCMFYMLIKLSTVSSLMGCDSLISEETDGTIEFLYAMPHSRAYIAFSKFVSCAITIVALNVLCGLVSYLAFLYMGEEPTFLPRSIASVILPQLCYLITGMLISSLLRSSQSASTSSMSLFFFTFMLGVLPSMIGKWNKLEYLSPTTAVIRYDFMTVGFRPYWPQVNFLLVYSIIALITTIVIYSKKDMKLQ
ncbi:MAG: ABC transporter permease subunit [Clostridia bacterium]|nr:ABC transporter permease subunit [Clostridia bacterium]